MDTLKQLSKERMYWEGGKQYVIRVTYGFDTAFAKRHNQSPHFSMTGETFRRVTKVQAERTHEYTICREGIYYENDGGGQIVDAIKKHFPELAPIAQWHLCSLDKGPMHYVANAMYWLKERNEKHFKSTILYRALPSDGISWDFPPYTLLAFAWERRENALGAFKECPGQRTRGELDTSERHISRLCGKVERAESTALDFLKRRLPMLLEYFRGAMLLHGLIVENETQSISERE